MQACIRQSDLGLIVYTAAIRLSLAGYSPFSESSNWYEHNHLFSYLRGSLLLKENHDFLKSVHGFAKLILHQMWWRSILFSKFSMRSNVIGTDAQHDNSPFLHLMIGIAKRARFSRTARGVVFGQKNTRENDVLPCTCRQPAHRGDGCHDLSIQSCVVTLFDRSALGK